MKDSELRLLKPPGLRIGETIGIFTPSFPAHSRFRAKYLHGVQQIRNLGFDVEEGELTRAVADQGYRSGSPSERADELMKLFLNNRVRAIMATTGGNNSSSLIPFLDFAAIRANPKILCGYSDVTSLHLSILAYSKVSTFYGPAVVSSFGEYPNPLPETVQSFLDAATSATVPRRLVPPALWSSHFGNALTDEWRTMPRPFKLNTGWKTISPGLAHGPALIANLATLVTAAGTSYFPELDGRILVIEARDALLSREERSLRHLQLLGAFNQIAGLVVSKPETFDTQNAPFGHEELLSEILGVRSYPIVTNFDCGHTHPMLTLAQGVQITLDARAADAAMTIEESMCEP